MYFSRKNLKRAITEAEQGLLKLPTLVLVGVVDYIKQFDPGAFITVNWDVVGTWEKFGRYTMHIWWNLGCDAWFFSLYLPGKLKPPIAVIFIDAA